MMYLATVPREHLIAFSKRQPLKNDVVNPDRRQDSRGALPSVSEFNKGCI